MSDGQRDDLVSFELVYEAELTSLVRLATLLVGSQDLGEEAVHDAFLQLHTRWAVVENPGGFVRTAVVNRCRDINRRKARSERHLRSIHPSGPAETHYLVDALQELSELRRAVLVLRFYGNYKLREISEVLEVPEGTVRSNLSRGLDELREILR